MLIVVCLFAGFSTAYADENSRATFHNTKEDAPHLYVSKEVVSTNENYLAPEDVSFNFVLQLDGEPADEVVYRVFDKNGDEVFNYHLGIIKVDFKTSKSGNFTLEAGQTAMFEFLKDKSYEITEVDVPTNFTQVDPSGGASIKGTVLPDGSSESFTNAYTPPGEEKEYTALEVGKNITFPSGYQAPETPYFTFTLKFDGKIHANENYIIKNAVTNQKTGADKTTPDGTFKIKAGEIARFENILTNIDYEVTESKAEGWTSVGETTKKGATKAPLTNLSFTNRNASFGVSKKLVDNSASEDIFTFTLTDGKRDAIPGAKYYLYKTDGARADDKVYSTDANGDFTLKANQAAIFIGMENGTVYNVSEQGSPNYIQTLPASNEGYKDKVISDAFEMLPFINTPQVLTKALTVTKVVSSSDEGEMPIANDDFTFVLSKKTNDVYVPVAEGVYSITEGSSTSTHKTDSEGKFTIKRNQTAVFERLNADETYKVEEVDLSVDYTCETTVYEGLLSDNLSFTFDNKFVGRQVDLYINKTNTDNDPLSGAAFDLFTDEQLVNRVNTEDLISDADGKISLKDIVSGTYYLKETEAPKGYQLLEDPIKIDITRNGNDLKVMINDEDSENISVVDITKNGYIDDVTLKVVNHKGFEIPQAGGIGIHWYIIIAIVGITLISLILRRRGKTVNEN